MADDVSKALSRVHRWVGLPVLAFSLGISGLWLWKQQLTQQLRGASAELRIEECLRLERRLQSLEWVPSPATQDSGRCRREAAERLWQGQKQAEALRLQQELVNSKAAKLEDIERLQTWKGGLQRLALQTFERGELEQSLALLRLTDTAGGDPGVAAMVNQFQQTWGKNKLDLERASSLAARGQWWEALSALNGLSHPYWRQKSLRLRQTVEAGLAKVEKKRVEVHGPLPYAISPKRLDELVKKRVAAGVPDWQAFSEACRALGGRLEDKGPEATCER
ncbi:MAG: hypothetical protein VKN83_10370 [Cyanobacteriota bacterium]|nr:hypothetical protein [Cyanobacteriota bacterium]